MTDDNEPVVCIDTTWPWAAARAAARDAAWNASQTEDMLRGEIIKWIEAANAATKLINEQQRETLNLRQLLREAYEHLDTHDLGCPVGEGYGEPCRCGLPALRRRIEEAVGVAK